MPFRSFRLTAAQDRVVAEIRADLESPRPMHRLLQGDVGSGKTAVAVYAMLAAVATKLQAALLAPTEILVEQHLTTLSRWLAGAKVRIGHPRGGRQRAGALLLQSAGGGLDPGGGGDRRRLAVPSRRQFGQEHVCQFQPRPGCHR